MNKSKAILESWHANAAAWNETVQHQEIESRTLATNEAIITAVKTWAQPVVLDVGCGEGWLTKEIRKQNGEAYGVDATAELIDYAKKDGSDYFFTGTYQQLAQQQIVLPVKPQTAVINFALIDKDDTEQLIKSFQHWLGGKGRVIIQTLHPVTASEDQPYATGWRQGSWNGMKRQFVQPYAWYFRTIGDWVQLFAAANLSVLSVAEPVHPHTGQPLSIIFVLQLNNKQ